MKAAVEKPGQPPCLVRWIGLRGITVRAITYCGTEYKASDGISQIPDEVRCCTSCETAMKQLAANWPVAVAR